MRSGSFFMLLAAAMACSSTNSSPSTDGGSMADGADTGTPSDGGSIDGGDAGSVDAGDGGGADGGLVAQRPYHFQAPSNYDPSKPTPLLVMLHGYSADGPTEEAYFQLGTLVDAKTILYAYPDGTKDPMGNRFWNADDACCDAYGIPVDDVAYVGAILDDVESKYNVDRKRVWIVGHSNGAFMAHRLACDLSARVAAIVSLAGAVWNDPSKCNPTEHVAVLDVHGDADTVVSYTGGASLYPGGSPFPSEMVTMATWASKDACSGSLADTGQRLDLDSSLAGSETKVQTYGGCPAGLDVQLWTIQGGAHVPSLAQPTWPQQVYAFLSAHPKP
jgi:polyhydroxybutyrate depolymerase